MSFQINWPLKSHLCSGQWCTWQYIFVAQWISGNFFFLPIYYSIIFLQIPQAFYLLILFSIHLRSGHFYTPLTSSMIDLKRKIEKGREKYCARTIFHHKIHLLECKSSQNPAVLVGRFILETKRKICSDNVKILPSYFSFQILFILFYIIMAHVKTWRWNRNQT